MKILAIRIRNLASLEGTTEINFIAEPLCSAGIFAITGVTGAGKSTILDALCLALYGKTPRYVQAKEIGVEIQDIQGSTINQGDVRGILRDGTAEGFAEVDFVGIDGQHYRATWSVRRAKSSAEGNIQADSISLKEITSNIDLPGKKMEIYKKIERLIGLNFEQFTRSVLLAQGDFTAFLKANKDEKSSLLEKLTGSYIYSEISKKIYEKYQFEKQKLNDLNILKEGINTLTEEELKILSQEQTALETDIKVLEKEIETLTQEIRWHEQMIQLQSSLDTANTTLLQASEIKVNASQRKKKLYQTEQAEKTRSWVDALKHAQQEQEQKTKTLLSLEKGITLLERQKQELEKQLAVSECYLFSKNKVFTDALSLLEEAKKLDILLSEKKEQLLSTKDELENASKKSKQYQKILTDKQAELASILDQIKMLEAWKTKNMKHRLVAENKHIILSKLKDAEKLLQTLESCTKEIRELQEKITTKETEKEKLETNLKAQQQEWELLKKSYNSRSKELLLIPIETLHLDKDEVGLALQNMTRAQAHWQIFYSLLVAFDALNEKQLKDQSDYESKEKMLEELTQRLLNKNIAKETSEKLLQKARLAATENVEMLRGILVDNEPCPVCGSESHPYTVHNPKLESVLAALEKTHEENDKSYFSTLRQHSSLKQECQTLKITITSQIEDLNTRKIVLKSEQQKWEKFDVSKESCAIVNDKKMNWIEEKLQSLKKEEARLQIQIQTHTNQKELLESNKAKLDLLKETVDSITIQIIDVKNTLDLHHEKQRSRLKEQEKTVCSLNEVEDTLTGYFVVSNWMENWKIAPVSFLDQITSFVQNWKENSDNTERNIRLKDILVATLKELESQNKNLLAEASQKSRTYAIQNTNYLKLIQQRNIIFGGQSVQDIEKQLKQAIEEAQFQFDKLRATQQQLILDCTKAITQKEQILEEITKLEDGIKIAVQKIQNWLDTYNEKQNMLLNQEALFELLSLNSDWIDSERTSLQAIDEEVTKATSIVTERKQLLEMHQQKCLDERSLDELTTLNISAKSNVERSKESKNKVSFRLQQDKINKSSIGDLLKSITTQGAITENWGKLNDIIGSADGKKFRQIAQEYTLDVLLGYANIHLETLTNRYKIQRIPASLGMQVVDQDMGDEIRTVYSLSGGESFLVSLALALGLASLSSSKMKVESLFIDEGFGSLDPNTLTIAMDALGRLHNQGRKVGVISHVQEMTEWIPTQIKVSKMANGKSKVEVLGI